MEMRVPDGGCFCLFAFPIGRFDLCFCFGRSFAAGCPTPICFIFFYVKSACPQHASVIKLYHAA